MNEEELKREARKAYSKKRLKELEEAAAEFPGGPETYSGRGIANWKLGNFTDAKIDFTESIYLQPFYTEYIYLALVHLELGDYQKAVSVFNNAAKKYGKKHEELFLLARECLRELEEEQPERAKNLELQLSKLKNTILA